MPRSPILHGDKGYDSDDIRRDLIDRGIEPVIPPRSNRKTPIEYDREAYKRRNLIERCVNRLKQFRRIATRYEKTPERSSPCYALQPQGFGLKLSTRPSQHHEKALSGRPSVLHDRTLAMPAALVTRFSLLW